MARFAEKIRSSSSLTKAPGESMVRHAPTAFLHLPRFGVISQLIPERFLTRRLNQAHCEHHRKCSFCLPAWIALFQSYESIRKQLSEDWKQRDRCRTTQNPINESGRVLWASDLSFFYTVN